MKEINLNSIICLFLAICFLYYIVKKPPFVLFNDKETNSNCLFLCPRDRRSGGILFLSCLSFCHYVILSSSLKLQLANNFWTVSARALIFHMSIPCDKTFRGYHYLWPWPWSLTYFLKTLTLRITFEHWVLELWYFTWVILVIRPFSRYHYFWPCDLDPGVWPIFWKL